MNSEYNDKATELEKFTNLLANLLAKYASEVDVSKLPDKQTTDNATE